MVRAYPAFKAAVMHAAPVFLDTARTVAKACALIQEAARNGAQFVAFPEAFISAFPVWSALAAPIRTHVLFKALAASAIELDGPEMEAVREEARRCGVLVSIGFNEGTRASVGCVWNANALIDADGAVLNHHRKLVPTYFEKLVWANGDGAGLRVSDTKLGRIGMLICGENTNPLARYTLMAQGEQVHVSSWPPIWPTHPPNTDGAYDIEQAIRIRAGAHSFEAKVFNIVTSACVDATLRQCLERTLGREVLEIIDHTPRAVSTVIGPNGMPISEALSREEGVLYVDIDTAQCVEPKQFHDVTGYYNRFDVFRLTVDRSRNRPLVFHDEEISSNVGMLQRSGASSEQTPSVFGSAKEAVHTMLPPVGERIERKAPRGVVD